MRKRAYGIVLMGAMVFGLLCVPAGGDAEVNVNIGINVPPVVAFPGPPAVLLIPGTYAYFVPDVEVDIFFYHGYWYRPHKGYWFRSANYNGPWGHIVTTSVPRVVVQVPPDFRRVPPGHQRIPYGQLKKNWSKWEKEKYWDKHDGKGMHKDEKGGYKEDKGEHGEGKGKGKGKHKGN
jgi:hypothetical protein